MATKQNLPDSAALAGADDPNSQFFGHGGSYRFDPATGQTSLLERAGDAPKTTPAQQPESIDSIKE